MSKLNKAQTAYTFDDFQLIPIYSTIQSRKDPDISISVGEISHKIPIISSPMNTITEDAMVRTMHDLGGSSIIHRYMDIDKQVKMSINILNDDIHDFWVAVGANGDSDLRIDALAEAGVFRLCVDVANGHSQHCINTVRKIRNKYPSFLIMAGNVCTYDGALRLADEGANAIRVGIGGGSMCTTRLVTGYGVPQLTATEQCSYIKNVHPDVCIISDGGLRNSGDIVKALAIGADMVMLGSLLSGTSNTPGEVIRDLDGFQFKHYSGMASEAARDQWFSRDRTAFVPEGASTKVAFKGETVEVVQCLIGGLQVGMSYANANDLSELKEKAQWVRITNAGLREATPHGKQ